ncbi:CBS and ACT domain-containing protein [Brevibacillus sp. SYSU BS000544]|uniref:CBS and ACT domain-containing protein n=1 Tax=Brevibacillus sp. SYSU BS000544 TaxID=3416443 RepID=UPI003CE4C777
MFVRQWMKTNPKTVMPETSLSTAINKMKEWKVRRFPVVNADQVVVGFITDGDCLKASPSDATSLSKHEIAYLLEQVKVKDIMSKKIISVSPDMLVEEAILIMRQNSISGVPVVDNGKLVGIITQADVFDAFTDILGAGQPGVRMLLELEDRSGVLAEVATTVSNLMGNITSIAEFHNNQNGKVYLLLRFSGDRAQAEQVSTELQGHGHQIVSVHVVD